MNRLADFFHKPLFESALNQYIEFAEERDWPISEKLEMYNWAKIAFDSTKPEKNKRKAFRKIYDNLRNNWQVFRKAKGSVWTSDQTFDMLNRECSACSRQSSLSLQNIRLNSQESQRVLASLEHLRDLKPQNYYPWVAVAKFTHFYNPSLFPIYDISVVWHDALNGVFRNDYRNWCKENDLYWNDQTARFNLNYLCFAADMIRQADNSFMQYFSDWFKQQVVGHPDEQGVLHEMNDYYSTAFEFVAIGASHL